MSDLELKRAAALSVRLQYSAQSATQREAAIDRIVEQLLCRPDIGGTASAGDIAEKCAVEFPAYAGAITRHAITQALERLERQQRVSRPDPSQRPARFQATAATREEREREIQQAEKRLVGTVSRFLDSTVRSAPPYSEAFLWCLGSIFAHLGNRYADEITGSPSLSGWENDVSIEGTVARLPSRLSVPDVTALCRGLRDFVLDKEHPDTKFIKWNLAQNHYVLKMLGLDPGGHYLSRSVLEGTELYLDTNVVVDALAEIGYQHKRFVVLADACRATGAHLKVADISLDELARLVESKKTEIRAVLGQIPEDTPVDDVFYQVYTEAAAANSCVSVADALWRFGDPGGQLSESYGVEVVALPAPDEPHSAPAAHPYVPQVQRAYEEHKGKGKRKRKPSAAHDARMLRYVEALHRLHGIRAWFVTLDGSLPRVQLGTDQQSKLTVAIHLSALLQWISPLVSHGEADLADAYADALRSELLPKDVFFELGDFRVFADMGMECAHLPREDVEDCIRHVKSTFADLDPARPEDQIRIQSEIGKYFADPGRKYKQELERAKQAETALRQQLEEDQLHREAERKESRDALERQDAERREAEALATKRALRAEGWLRFSWSLIVCMLLEAGAMALAMFLGEGKNWLQKLGDTWWLLPLPLAAWVVFLRCALDRPHAQEMGWVSRLFPRIGADGKSD